MRSKLLFGMVLVNLVLLGLGLTATRAAAGTDWWGDCCKTAVGGPPACCDGCCFFDHCDSSAECRVTET